MEKTWEEMTSDEKQEAKFQELLSLKDAEGNDMQFQSPEAKEKYIASLTSCKTKYNNG